MTFLNFSQLPESVFNPNFSGKHFPKNQAKIFFYWKVFSIDQLSNGKQTQKSLESDFPETTFRKTNTAKRGNTFLKTKPNFSLTEKCFSLTETYFPLTRKCFSLTNFSNDKQTSCNIFYGN